MAEVKVAGRWLAELPGTVTGLRWGSRWGEGPSGPSEAAWQQDLPLTTDVTWLAPGAVVEVFVGGNRVWRGLLEEPVRGVPWSFTARGVAGFASSFAAIDGSNNPTTVPSTAVTQAVARGWPATVGVTFSGSAYGQASPTQTNRLDALLNGWSQATNVRWGVDKDGVAFARADATTATLVLEASDVQIGVADDSLFTVVVARYVSSLTTPVDAGDVAQPNGWSSVVVTDAAAVARWGRREYVMDLTKLGLLTGGTATSYATQQLSQLTVPAWTNRVTVDSSKLRTLGGLPVDPTAVEAGQVVRLFGLQDGLGRLRSELQLNVPLGEVDYEDGSPLVTLAPVKLAARTLADVIADLEPAENAQQAFA